MIFEQGATIQEKIEQKLSQRILTMSKIRAAINENAKDHAHPCSKIFGRTFK